MLKTKREIVAEVLEELLTSSQRVAIADAVEPGRERGISRRTLSRVDSDMGVRAVMNGRNGGIWERGTQ